KFAKIEDETGSRARTPECLAHPIVATSANQCIMPAFGIHGKNNAGVVAITSTIGQIDREGMTGQGLNEIFQIDKRLLNARHGRQYLTRTRNNLRAAIEIG